MFKRIAPQRAQNTSGCIVQVGSRDSIQYLDNDTTAEVEADLLCQIVPIYYETLTLRKAGGIAQSPSMQQRELIINQIKCGLDCLGIRYEMTPPSNP